MKKIFGFVWGVILFLSLVSAATDTVQVDDVFQVNTVIDYSKPCFNNGTYCSDSAECRFTFYKPDNSILANGTATNRIINHNFSVTFSDLGIHQIDMQCTDGTLSGAETFYAEITGSGFNSNIWYYVIIFILLIGLIILGFSVKDPTFVILASFGLAFMGIYTLLNGIAGIRNLTTTYAIAIIILGTAGYLGIRSGWELINGGG